MKINSSDSLKNEELVKFSSSLNFLLYSNRRVVKESR